MTSCSQILANCLWGKKAMLRGGGIQPWHWLRLMWQEAVGLVMSECQCNIITKRANVIIEHRGWRMSWHWDETLSWDIDLKGKTGRCATSEVRDNAWRPRKKGDGAKLEKTQKRKLGNSERIWKLNILANLAWLMDEAYFRIKKLTIKGVLWFSRERSQLAARVCIRGTCWCISPELLLGFCVEFQPL